MVGTWRTVQETIQLHGFFRSDSTLENASSAVLVTENLGRGTLIGKANSRHDTQAIDRTLIARTVCSSVLESTSTMKLVSSMRLAQRVHYYFIVWVFASHLYRGEPESATNRDKT